MILILFMIVIFSLGLIKRNSKFIFFLQMFSIWLFMGWNNGGMDYKGNEAIFYSFENAEFGGLTSGWLSGIISNYFISHGMSFIQYNIFTSLIALLLISYVVLKETSYPCPFACLFLIYPFCDSIIQKRFFVGMAFSFLGLYYLRRNNKTNFLISIICAIGFHFSFVLYLPLIFWKKMKNKAENIVVFLLLTGEIVVLSFWEPLLNRIIPAIKVNAYLSTMHYSSWRVAICFLIAQLLYFYIYQKIYQKSMTNCGSKEENICGFIYSMNKFSLILCPLCLYESVFMRYYRIVLLYEYIVLANAWGNYYSSKKMLIKENDKWLYILVAYLLLLNTVLLLISKPGLHGFINTLFSNQLL